MADLPGPPSDPLPTVPVRERRRRDPIPKQPNALDGGNIGATHATETHRTPL